MQDNFQEKYKLIADRYVNALVQIADERNLWDTINHDLLLIEKTLKENSELENFFLHPVISLEHKKEVAETVFKNAINEKVFNLLNLILEKNRCYIISSIKELFNEKLLKKNNIINAYVTSAIELDFDMKEKLTSKLCSKLNKQVNLVTTVNTDIIGGAILQIEDKVIDGSIKNKLESFKKQLI